MTIIVFVPGDPKPQPRPRAFSFRGHARVYDAGTAEGWKSLVAAKLQPWAGTQADGPAFVVLQFVLRRPKSHFRKDGVTLTKSAAPWPMGKFDCDNLAKAVLDCATTVGIWKDDGQVVDLKATKSWAAEWGPGVQINLSCGSAEGASLGPACPTLLDAALGNPQPEAQP